MSKDIIVLAPNGRRQKVHCTPDTSILQVLEDVCKKQGFQAIDYNLKHHNLILDLTTTIRFSNLPNKATLEMVEAEKKREETNVTVGLMLEDGDRRTADFVPSTSLYDLIITLAPTELQSLVQPTILYMRQEVVGELALKEKTLRHLGLIGGRAILRLLNKGQEGKQANVSKVYQQPIEKPSMFVAKPRTLTPEKSNPMESDDMEAAGPSNAPYSFNPVNIIKNDNLVDNSPKIDEGKDNEDDSVSAMDVSTGEKNLKPASSSSLYVDTQEKLERRLNIEEEVTFLGTQRAIAFMQPDDVLEELEDLPDDFYELTVEEVRKLYNELHRSRLELEDTPLTTSSQKEGQKQTSIQKLNVYKNVVVRIQFPDRIILQGVFAPTDSIQDIINFIKSYLHNPEKPFHIFTTPLKETLDPAMTLQQAKFVPCVHMHFKWLDEPSLPTNDLFLREEIYNKQTTCDAASILASKYRAPSRRKLEDGNSNTTAMGSSTSKSSKVPKWFKK